MGYLLLLNLLRMGINELKVIIERIKNGDQDLMGQLYRSYRSEFIAWLSTNFDCTDHEAREMYQVSIHTLYENVLDGSLTELTSDIKTYLFAIGKNQFLAYRKARNRIQHTFEFPEKQDAIPEKTNSRREEKELLKVSLQKLGDPCRSMLELYYYHGYSMKEISERMEYKNPSTVKNLKYKCLQRLRRLFLKALPNHFNSET